MEWISSYGRPICIYGCEFSNIKCEKIWVRNSDSSYFIDIDVCTSKFLYIKNNPIKELGNYDVSLLDVNQAYRIGNLVISDPQDGAIYILKPENIANPYTIAFMPNGSLSFTDGSRVADDILSRKDYFYDLVARCLDSLFCHNEDVLCRAGIFDKICVKIVESNIDSNSTFVDCVFPNIARPNQKLIHTHLSMLNDAADVAFVLHAALDHTRASAMFSVDNRSESKRFTCDNVVRSFGKYTDVPGVATIGFYDYDTSHTPLHEFGHAASERDNGRVTDLYHDFKDTKFDINEKKRTGSDVPEIFCDYQGATFMSDSKRDSLGYGSWKTYHPEPINGEFPNLMDDYWLSKSSPFCCRFDKLTRQWFEDRLKFKCDRGSYESSSPEGVEGSSRTNEIA